MRNQYTLLFAFFLFLLAPELQAADNDYKRDWNEVWELVKKYRTKSAVEILQKIRTRATQEKNEREIVNAVLAKHYIQRNGGFDNDAPIAQEIMSDITATSSPLIRSVLYHSLGEYYWRYYQFNSWRFYNRTLSHDTKSHDITTWDPSTFRDTARCYYLKALTEEKALKDVRIQDVQTFSEYSPVTLQFPMTLYDFLVHKTIVFLQQSQPMSNDIAPEVNTIDALAPLDIFLTTSSLASSVASQHALAVGNHHYLILSLYQKILGFHRQDTVKTSLIESDIVRLQFARSVSSLESADSLYLHSLKRIMDVYSSDSCMTLAAYVIAQEFNKQNQPIDAMHICERAIELFPNSNGAQNCDALKAQINRKELSISLENTTLPNVPSVCTITSKNVTKLHFRIVKTDYNSKIFKKIRYNDYSYSTEDRVDKILDLSTMHSWEMTLPQSSDFLPHSVDVRLPALSLGQYFLVVSPKENFSLDSNAIAFSPIFVTRLFLHHQIFPQNGAVVMTVHDAESGKPLPDVTVNCYTGESNYRSLWKYDDLIITKKTSSNGECIILPKENNRKSFLVELISNDDYFLSENTFSAYEQSPEKDHNRTLFFTDRQIYRPGQTIYFKGIIYKNNNQHAVNEVLKNEKTIVRFFDVTYKEVTKLELRTNEFGSFSGSFTAPNTGLTGSMNIRNESGRIDLRVEEYKRPKFEVQFNPTKGEIVLGKKVTATGNALSFAGATISGASVSYRITRSARFPYRVWDYSIQTYGYSQLQRFSQQQEIARGTTTTNASGEFMVEFTARPDKLIPKKNKPVFTYTVSADVTDINGETHSSQTVVSAGYISLELGLAIGNDDGQSMMYDDESNPSNRSGNEPFVRNFKQNIRITSKNINQTLLPARGTLKTELLEQPKRSGILRDRLLPQPDQFPMSKNDFIAAFPNDSYQDDNLPEKWTVAQVIDSKEIQTDSTGLLITGIDRLLAPGMYRITLQSKDISGAALEVVRHCVVYDSSAKTPAIRMPVTLIPQNVICEPGEKATFLFGTSYPSATVRYQFEYRNQMLDQKLIEFSNEMREFSIPIEEKHRGGFTIYLTMVHDGRMYARAVHVAVPWSNKDLTIETATFRDKVQPGAKESWRLTIKNKDGKAPTAEMVARLYDASLDAYKPNWWEEFGWMNMYATMQVTSATSGVAQSQLYEKFWNYFPLSSSLV
ncbi:MAG: hypothetical protein IPM69_08520 [Ignavibacteria bacterium]|nr:hypothetical protein [Ignavibacteria bacterium]